MTRRLLRYFIDAYNDFISQGGKVGDRLEDVAEANKCVPHMKQFWMRRERAHSRFP
jgi:hypothetical protein